LDVSFVVFCALCVTTSLTTCLISFGANLGEPEVTLDRVVQLLRSRAELAVCAVSRAHWSRAVGGPLGQPDYLNAVIRAETELSPLDVLQTLQGIEQTLGRDTAARWAARLVDLDLLVYGQQQVQTDDLVVPHPRMSYRRFVLEPAVEVAADLVHPTLGMTLKSLLTRLDQADQYIALVGTPNCGPLVGRVCRGGLHVALSDPCEALREAGRSAKTEIESLRARAEALRSAHRVTPDGAYLLSSFWCEQPLIQIAASFDHDEAQQFRQVWEELHPSLPRLKLLVVVQGSGAADRSFVEAVRRYLERTPVGPMLTVPNDDSEWAEIEILAAIAAM
jgi:2-amino-4-hydroxy-6-hydroxymethyldihydropteridine diphosphokinase